MAKLSLPFNRVYEYTNRSMLQFANALCPYLKKIGCISGVPGGGYANYVEVPISSAQILNMSSVNIVLLPPLPNTQYYKYEIFFEYTPGSSAYTVAESYILQGGITYLHAEYPNTMLGTNKLVFIGGSQQGQIQLAGLANRPAYNLSELTPTGIRLVNKDNPTGGDGTILAKIWYTILTIG